MFKTRKNFEKMDKKNVQKSICRITFVQKRAALGNLRNFFGGIFVRAYMVRRSCASFKPILWGRCQKGAKRRMHVPFWSILVFRKKLFAFWGLSSADLPRMHVPFWGILVFRKKLFAFWGLSSADLSQMHVPFWSILVFRKKLFAFWGLSSADLSRMHVPFWSILVFR